MAHGLTNSDTMFSVREVPWHGKGKVLETYPGSIDEALDASGLGWGTRSTPVYVGSGIEGAVIEVPGWKANVRTDTGAVLGIVSDDYEIVSNRDAFRFMDALIGSEVHFETAGSLWGGKRVWVLARLPEFVELGGDKSATYLYVANSHDGSMAVTAATTPIRIVCNNTLGAALRRSEYGDAAQRTYRFAHRGDLQARFLEARKVIQIAVNYEARFKARADQLASEFLGTPAFEQRVLRQMWPVQDDMPKIARGNRERTIEKVLAIWHGRGPDGDTTGNSPGTKWMAYNAVAEHLDYGRRYTKKSNQVARSFEWQGEKDKALALVEAA